MEKQQPFYINSEGTAERSKQKKEITERYCCEICGSGFNSHFLTVTASYSDDYFNIERCKNCGLIFVNPRLNSEFRNFCYEKETHLLDYFLQREKEGTRIAGTIIDILENMGYKEGNLLEFGSGIGIFLDKAAKQGFNVTGVELNEKTAQYASQKYNVIHDDLYSVALPDLSFDVVVMDQTLEHLGEPLKALKKIRKLLKPGGCLFIGVPKVDWLVLVMDKITNRSKKLKKSNYLWSAEDHLFYFTPSAMKKMLTKAGFKHEDIKTNFEWRIKGLMSLSSGYFLAWKN